MRYLKVCNVNDQKEYQEAIRQIGIAFGNYARLSGRRDVAGATRSNVFYQGSSRVHAEYNVLYLAINDQGILDFLDQVIPFRGRFRRPELVRIDAQV